MMKNARQWSARFTRRDFLATFGVGGLAVALAAACRGVPGSGEPGTAAPGPVEEEVQPASASSATAASGERAAAQTATTDTASVADALSDPPACILTPEATEGPFYFDTEMLRRDITEDRSGAPLAMAVRVLRMGNTCAPLPDAVVDLWHADADGVYSGYRGQLGGLDTSGETFLRGVQVTDADGIARFETVYPGWYPGRTAHIHFKVHYRGTTFLTSQFYFDDELTDQVYLRSPYNNRPNRSTRNENDGELRGNPEEWNLLASVAEDRNGYTGVITVGVAVSEG